MIGMSSSVICLHVPCPLFHTPRRETVRVKGGERLGGRVGVLTAEPLAQGMQTLYQE